jgi:pantothenate kinase type III
MVLAAGATLQFPGMNRLVIDAGTCVTFDFIESDKYLGGAIAPGCNCVTSHYMILLLSCHCYLWRVLKV